MCLDRFAHTDDHASTDIAEFGFLAVVILEFVGFVIDPNNGLRGRFWFLFLHFNFLFVNEVDLEKQ